MDETEARETEEQHDEEEEDGQWETCPECGVEFGITTALYKQRQRFGKTFYCPNGHACCYPKPVNRDEELEQARSRATKAEGEAALLRAELQAAKDAAHGQAEYVDRLEKLVMRERCWICRLRARLGLEAR